jgi:hypothetical protein
MKQAELSEHRKRRGISPPRSVSPAVWLSLQNGMGNRTGTRASPKPDQFPAS